MLFLQVPGADEAISEAAKSGWVEVLLVLLVLFLVSGLSYLARLYMVQNHDREERMAKRIDKLEEDLRNSDKQHSGDLLALTMKVTEVVTISNTTSSEMRESLDQLAGVMGEMNGDIKELCSLLKT